jgi:vancomycin resistance protein YoaR
MKNTFGKLIAIAAIILVLLAVFYGIRHFQKQIPSTEPQISTKQPADNKPVEMTRKKTVDVKFIDGEHEISFKQVPLYSVTLKEDKAATMTVDGNLMKALVEKIPNTATQTAVPSQLKKAAAGNLDRLTRGGEIEQIDRNKTLAALEKAIKEAPQAATITVDVFTASGEGPESFKQKRIEMGFTTLIASFSTLHEGHIDDEGRNVNLALAAEKIDGIIVPPGGKFSFNKVVGPRTEKCGFKKAGVISQGKVIPGLGGGICQVSTTLYRTALQAGLKIDERHNHSIYDGIEYADRGLDAAVAWGYKDFKFSNSLDLPVLISAKAGPGSVAIELFAERVPFESVVLETRNEKVHPFRTEIKKNHKLKKGDRKILHPGVTGYSIETYRIITRKDGKTREERMSKDRYLTFNRIEETNN